MKKIILIIAVLISLNASAQQDPIYSQYMFNMLAINPAYAGSREILSTTILYRTQWVNIDGAPTTVAFSADMPIMKKQIGLGINFADDQLGVTHNTVLNISYAYRLRVSENGMLGMGLQGGFNQYKADFISVNTTQNSSYQADVAFASNINRFLPNAGIGLWFATDRLYLGASVPKLLRNRLSDVETSESEGYGNRQNYHYFITGGYVFALNDVLKLKPSALLKVVHGSPIQMDLNANLWMHDVVGVGISYRSGDSIDLLLEFQVTSQFRIGYAFDYALTDLQQYNSGTHEIMLRYEFGFDKGKILSPRHF